MTNEKMPGSPVSAITNISTSETVVAPASSHASPRADCSAHFDAVSSSSSSSSSSSISSDDNRTNQNQSNGPDTQFNPEPIQGWPRLAAVMGKNPELAAFSRFRDLNVKSLLYYQAQLTILRKKLHELEYEDAGRGRNWANSADDLVVNADSEQFKTVEEMRNVLKEYNEALLQYTQICALPHPEPYNMRTLRQWIRNRYQGDSSIVAGQNRLENTWGDLYDPFKDVWNPRKQMKSLVTGLFWAKTLPEDQLDLAATTPKEKIDGLTRWIVCELITSWKDWRKYRRYPTRTVDVEDNTSAPAVANSVADPTKWVAKMNKEDTLESWGNKAPLRITATISTVIACLLPVAAISILSQLHGLKNLLICLGSFALVFALALIFLTQGTSSRTEIFAATAAFSAVMVVFISVPPAPVTNIVMAPGSPILSVSPSPTPVR